MDARYASERSTGAVLLFIAALGAWLLLAGCVTRPGDGVRVASQKDAIDMGGQVPAGAWA